MPSSVSWKIVAVTSAYLMNDAPLTNLLHFAIDMSEGFLLKNETWNNPGNQKKVEEAEWEKKDRKKLHSHKAALFGWPQQNGLLDFG